MNLKEESRYQNKLQALVDEAQGILSRESNVKKVESTYLHKKVMAEAEIEITVDLPCTEYAEQSAKSVQVIKGRKAFSALPFVYRLRFLNAKERLQLPDG